MCRACLALQRAKAASAASREVHGPCSNRLCNVSRNVISKWEQVQTPLDLEGQWRLEDWRGSGPGGTTDERLRFHSSFCGQACSEQHSNYSTSSSPLLLLD